MTASMQLAPKSLSERHPLADQARQLGYLAGMFLAQSLKDGDFVRHQHQRPRHGINAASDHLHVSMQGLAGEDDAPVGFGWGHGCSA